MPCITLVYNIILVSVLTNGVSPSGVSCPRAANKDDPSSGDLYGQQALFFTKEIIMQREVCCISIIAVKYFKSLEYLQDDLLLLPCV